MKNLVNGFLNSTQAPNQLRDIFEYTLLSSGKLLRPVIVGIFADSFNLKSQIIDNLKLAIEMIHAASLIHDDLPGLDNDEIRRGLPTVHLKFGEGRAILAGDLMLVKALNLFKKNEFISVHDSALIIELLIAAQCALCEGQAAELELKLNSSSRLQKLLTKGGKQEAISILEDINLKKTGALFIASAMGPAVLTNQPTPLLNSIEKLMKNFSLAFQIKDDILDSIHDSPKDGDAECNHVSLLGVAESKKYLDSLIQNTIGLTKDLGPRFSDFLVLIEEVFY